MKNVVVFVGSRANNGRLNSLIKELQISKEFEVHVIGACSLNQIEHDLVLDYYIHADMYNDTPGNRGKTISMVISSMVDWLGFWKMDYAICHGDRFETLGFAIACNYSQVPLVHMEAGELSNTDNDTRWAISELSQHHMANSFNSYSRLVKMLKYNPHRVGSPIADYILNGEFKKGEYDHVLIVYNPVSSKETDEFVKVIMDVVFQHSDIDFIWVNPNIDPGNKDLIMNIRHQVEAYPNLFYVKNLTQNKYIQLIMDSILMLGNASSGIHEGCVLGVPNLMYGVRQGCRELFQNSRNYYCYTSITNDIDLVLDSYKKDGLHRYKYKGELGRGDCSKKVVDYLIQLGE
jgi:UDP-hydrolysing UDP-N-acetyl-D-glucosamine 2-epimerase